MAQIPIYLDYNATTPIDPLVAAEMMPFLNQYFGNPSSAHSFGARTKLAVETARAQVAKAIGAQPDEILFTSGGSEANNTVILGVSRSLRDRGRHIITTAIEHPAVLEPCQALEREGFRVTVLPVDDLGRVAPSVLERAIETDTILITVMHANNEVGTIQPIEEIAAIARDHQILIHTDAAQTVGKIPVDVGQLGVDFLSVAGHKLYAPAGVGALYVRSGRPLPRLIYGAAHESGRRAGTENVLEIVGLGKACELAAGRIDSTQSHCAILRDRLWEGLSNSIESCRRNGDVENCLPNTLSISFRGVDASTLLAEISDQIAASAGAACHADEIDVSLVLEAMEIPLEWAMGTIRLSVGAPTTTEEIDTAVEIVGSAVARLGADAPAVFSATEEREIRLTRYTKGMGCACKLRPQDLEQVLKNLPEVDDDAVLLDMSSADDAAVYRINDEQALVQTVDFFTPVVDNPYDFGAVSAANSLSDIYAMGATPIFALSIVGFPSQRLPLSVLEKILEGATDITREAGIAIIGGHSVEDNEPKFGLAVSGLVHPDRMLTNAGAQPGDALVLTKPLGLGIIATAVKRGVADPRVAASALAAMKELNKISAEIMQTVEVHACTDVTGFGLLGHLREMSAASKLDAVLDFSSLPLLDGVRQLIGGGLVPGGTVENLDHVSSHVDFSDNRSRAERLILADAQTSGGLLIALPDRDAQLLVVRLLDNGVSRAAIIGRFTESGTGRIAV
jgi:cysteine desulfurase NifS/selenium donor protein